MSERKVYILSGAICVVGLAFACAWMEINNKDGSGFGLLCGLCVFFWGWTKKETNND